MQSMKSYKGIDRRRYQRVEGDFEIKIERVKQTEQEELLIPILKEGTSLNTSGCGMLFLYREPMTKGDEIKLSFLLKNSFEYFRLFGRVVRINRNPDTNLYSVAAEFIDIPKHKELELNYYLIKKDLIRF
jgi:c-di-GMP-binding flagellar brake protein YcgR